MKYKNYDNSIGMTGVNTNADIEVVVYDARIEGKDEMSAKSIKAIEYIQEVRKAMEKVANAGLVLLEQEDKDISDCKIKSDDNNEYRDFKSSTTEYKSLDVTLHEDVIPTEVERDEKPATITREGSTCRSSSRSSLSTSLPKYGNINDNVVSSELESNDNSSLGDLYSYPPLSPHSKYNLTYPIASLSTPTSCSPMATTTNDENIEAIYHTSNNQSTLTVPTVFYNLTHPTFVQPPIPKVNPNNDYPTTATTTSIHLQALPQRSAPTTYFPTTSQHYHMDTFPSQFLPQRNLIHSEYSVPTRSKYADTSNYFELNNEANDAFKILPNRMNNNLNKDGVLNSNDKMKSKSIQTVPNVLTNPGHSVDASCSANIDLGEEKNNLSVDEVKIRATCDKSTQVDLLHNDKVKSDMKSCVTHYPLNNYCYDYEPNDPMDNTPKFGSVILTRRDQQYNTTSKTRDNDLERSICTDIVDLSLDLPSDHSLISPDIQNSKMNSKSKINGNYYSSFEIISEIPKMQDIREQMRTIENTRENPAIKPTTFGNIQGKDRHLKKHGNLSPTIIDDNTLRSLIEGKDRHLKKHKNIFVKEGRRKGRDLSKVKDNDVCPHHSCKDKALRSLSYTTSYTDRNSSDPVVVHVPSQRPKNRNRKQLSQQLRNSIQSSKIRNDDKDSSDLIYIGRRYCGKYHQFSDGMSRRLYYDEFLSL